MLVFPDRVLHGAVPNKDFLYLYGPGSLWSLAGVYKVFGTHLLVERLAGLTQLVGMAVAAGLLVRWWGRWVAVAAVLLNVMFVMPALQLTAIPWTGGAALALGALVALAASARRFGVADRAEVGVARRRSRRLRDPLPHRRRARARARWRSRALGPPSSRRQARGDRRRDRALALPRAGDHGRTRHDVPRDDHRSDRALARPARHLPVPPSPDHLVGVARVIAAVDRSWPLPRFTPAQQLFVWFVLLAVIAVALVAFAIWRVRRSRPGSDRASCSRDRCSAWACSRRRCSAPTPRTSRG